MEWISIRDELPDRGARILVSDGVNIAHVYRLANPGYRVVASNDFVPLSDVTHWMPLPEPPKASQENNQ